MDDLISRHAAIDHLKKRLYETALNIITEHPYYEELADNRVDVWLNELPSAERRGKDGGNRMKNYTEAERRAYRNGYSAGWEKGNRDRDKAKGSLKVRKERPKATNLHDLSKLEFVKIARWLPLEGDGYADGAIVYDVWECSNCGNEERGEDVPETNLYCRLCGARMEATE